MFGSDFRPLRFTLSLGFQLSLLGAVLFLFVAGCDEHGAPMGERATTLSVKPSSATLVEGDSVQMKAVPLDSRGDTVLGYEVTWASEEDTVATVDTSGTAVAQNVGSTSITATAEKEGAESLSDRSEITVERPKAGSLRVSTSTSGGDLDPDGYSVVVDGSTSKDIGLDESATFSGLSEGDHIAELSGLQSNCSVDGANPRTVSVVADSTVSTAFDISCTSTTGSLKVSASTTGDDQDSDGYTATVDGETSKELGPNGSVTFSGLSEEDHSVELSGIKSNCSVDGQNPRTVTVEASNTVSTSFSVSCTATTGSLDVSASTSGDDQDSDGYTVTVDGSSSKDVGPNGLATFSGLSEGDHQVELSGIASNCSVGGENPRTVTVEAGNTVSTTFNVSCDPSFGTREAVLWEYEEWSLQNSSYSGNPFDVIATVTFEHQESSKSHTTEMFYDGDDTWKFRFTGTKTGTWVFTTSSSDPELDGLSGTVDVSINADGYGYIRAVGDKWARQTGSGLEAWTPVFRMAFDESTPLADFTSPVVSSQMNTHMNTEGFNGIFLFVAAKFADASLGTPKWGNVDDTNPDPASFAAIERLLSEIRSRGGGLHLWYAGECDDDQCPQNAFGDNGAMRQGEKRLLRYIAARLGPIPGWVMGYGWDIPAHASESDVTSWMSFLRSQMGWTHYLGARDQAGGGSAYSFVEESDFYSHGDYFGGVDNSTIQGLLGNTTDKIHSFDERWWESRLGSEAAIARQLWTTYMAGGASSIVGSMPAPSTANFDRPALFKTLFTFWERRFGNDLTPENSLTDGPALKDETKDQFVFYKEETSSIQVDLSGASGSLSAVAVDTKASYSEVDLGTLDATNQTIDLPYSSDWAIAVGSF